MRLVLDTNVWLDWIVFDDAGIAPIKHAVKHAQAQIFADEPCLQELRRVLGYRLRREVMTRELQEECVAECRRVVQLTAPLSVINRTLPVCRDSDDQKFLELARDCEADYLVSKDRQLLILSARRRPLLPFDVVTPRRLNDVLVSMV